MEWSIKDAIEQEDKNLWIAGQQASLTTHSTRNVLWEKVCLKFAYIPDGQGIYLILDPWYLLLDEANGRLVLSRYTAGSACAAWDIALPKGEWANLEISTTLSSITISINDQKFSYNAVDEVPTTFIQLHFSPGANFTKPELNISERVLEKVHQSSAPTCKALEMTVDFWDDLQLAAFDQSMLDEMFRIMALYGTNQAYWIHHGKRGHGGVWENSVASGYMQRTFDALGDDYLAPAVVAAHKSNIPLIGIFKPFDTTMCHYTNPARAGQGQPDALGGVLDQMFSFPVEHPELCQRRRNPPESRQRPTRIVITSRKQLPADAAQKIRLYASDDNADYSAYQGPFNLEVTDHEIQLNDLQIKEEFVMLVFEPELSAQVQNTLPDLVKMFDEAGQELEFTYGMTPRLQRKAEYHLDQHPELLDFRTHGINFDCAGDGMPSANCNPQKIQFDLFSPQQSHGLIGLAFNSNARAPGVLSEAEPEAQQWWLSMIEEMLEAGVDGVEIRLMNHSNVIDWEEYGFNQPVVDEYRRRYGVNITSQDFSRPLFRQLRGEFFTEFLRRASTLVRAKGKKFRVHIEDLRQGTASEPCPMEIEMQWRQWIAEGLCDGVSLKANNFCSHDTAFGRELLATCHAQGIPVSFTPFIHSPFMTNLCRETLDYALSSPIDAFNIYEFASLFAFAPDGTVSHIDESIIDWLKSYEWRSRENCQVLSEVEN